MDVAAHGAGGVERNFAASIMIQRPVTCSQELRIRTIPVVLQNLDTNMKTTVHPVVVVIADLDERFNQ